MGCFSWLDCKTKRPIRIGQKAAVLIPKDFGGGSYLEDNYNGYGKFEGHDVYELVAMWNKGLISEKNLKPAPPIEKFGGLWDFEKTDLRNHGYSEIEIQEKDAQKRQLYYDLAMDRRKIAIEMMDDFNSNKTDEYMREIYGDEYLRNIGINIANGDEQNITLKYPIKISHNAKNVYEECRPSLGDPNQGCF